MLRRIQRMLAARPVADQNPVAHELRSLVPENDRSLDIVAAKIGLVLLMIHSDQKVEQDERDFLVRRVQAELRLEGPDATRLADGGFEYLAEFPAQYGHC